jgi:hypothetical protein
VERHTCNGECFGELDESDPDYNRKVVVVLDCLVFQGVLAKLPNGMYVARETT